MKTLRLQPSAADHSLVEDFAGPVDVGYFASFRDIFLTTHALSDADLMAAPRQVKTTSTSVESSGHPRNGLSCLFAV
jgi:hypothetical protein